MKHARPDYQRIQDPAGIIPEDEPVFLLRGQDVNAPTALREYARLHLKSGGDSAISRATLEQAEAMERWQAEHTRKVADLPASSA